MAGLVRGLQKYLNISYRRFAHVTVTHYNTRKRRKDVCYGS